MTSLTSNNSYTVAVGAYEQWPSDNAGGITVLGVSGNGESLHRKSHIAQPANAGYLIFQKSTSVLFAVDEIKTDGVGPVGKAASVYSMLFSSNDSVLTPINELAVPGPFPTYLSLHPTSNYLACANHGSFDHVEKIVKTESGWGVEFEYDDSAVSLVGINLDGSLNAISDIAIFNEKGIDPNNSPQAGGHAQSSGHAHCATFHPSGKFIIVCDKATDKITVLKINDGKFTFGSEINTGAQTGPRHLIFNTTGDLAYATLEFSSELASFRFDEATGTLKMLQRVSTVSNAFVGMNEPADLRIHPFLPIVYVNNRGEDSLAWFSIEQADKPVRIGHVALSKSVHPGLAARSFAVSPSGKFLLVADRPANAVKSFSISETGSLDFIGSVEVPNAAYVEFLNK